MKRPVSIQDIAEAAGVSHTTVSRALHNSPLISSKVREQIQHIADEMGYVPNAVAQSLRGERTGTVGLIVTTIADPFVSRIARGIEDVAQKYNLSLFLSASYNNPEREIAVIRTFHRRRVDGLIVASSQFSAEYEQRLSHTNIPVVLINQEAETQVEMQHRVDVDDYAGACQAVKHLITLGHHQIGYLGASNRPRSNRNRLQAYHDTMARAGLPIHPDWIQIAPAERSTPSNDVADGLSLLPSLIRAGVTAVFCINDPFAVGALMYCRYAGISVPDHLSVVGFDDVEMAQYVTPPLTTVHQPKLRLGATAMEMLITLMQGGPVENHQLGTELVIRASTARPPEATAASRVTPAQFIPPEFQPPD